MRRRYSSVRTPIHHLCFFRRTISFGLAWARNIMQRVLKPALQICRAGSPDRGPPHAQHLHDLALRNLPIKGRENVGAGELARQVFSLGSKSFHCFTLRFAQLQFGLAHRAASVGHGDAPL
jgi:hypothetical protein